MKKFLFLVFALNFLGACSVDNQELEDSNFVIQDLNATYVSDGCSITTFDFSTLGNIEIRNDRDFLYVSIYAQGENTISAISLHIADDFSSFPTVGRGNLQPEKMEYQESFISGVNQHLFKFPLSDFNQNLAIASYTTFNGGVSLWGGDKAVRQGNWRYFDYQLKEHPVNAGPDNSRTMTENTVSTLPSWDEVRKVYAGMLAKGVDNKSGTYNPSIWDLINDFNDPARESRLGEYTTTYTLGSGDCTDSVVLTLIVVGDNTSESFN